MKYSTLNHKLYDFLDTLRNANIYISTNEVLLLFGSLNYTNLTDLKIFKQTLQTTLIKDYTDIPIFENCFNHFFLGYQGKDDPLKSLTDDYLSSQEEKILNDLIEDFLEQLEIDLILEKSNESLTLILNQELELSEKSGGGIGMLLWPLKKSFQQNYFKTHPHHSKEESELNFNLLLTNLINNKVKPQKIGATIKKREDYLFNKFIYQLTPEEIKEMKDLVKRFGQKLKNRISLRKKKVKRRGIDLKQTFRSSLQYGGIPFRVFYKNKKVDRPQIVILCDISGSVNQYTRFMLLLTHSLQTLFAKVRTFAFISKMVEITDLFKEMNPERAINSIFTDTNFTYGWGSNYGKSFDEFIENYSDSLNKKTTVLILGDGRNNYQDPGLKSFQLIKEKSKNLYWFNPDKKHLWNWSDSLASFYQKYCTEMKEVNSFLDLSEFIDKLF